MTKHTVPKDDAPIAGQKFFLINMASPSSERAKAPTNIFKVKFVCETLDEARTMAKEFQEADPDFDTYVGPVGRWIPFLDNPLAVENVEYQEQALTDLINDHRRVQKINNEKFMERVDRETKKILEHSKNQAKPEGNAEDHENMVKSAVTLRFNIYQIAEKIKSLQGQLHEMENEYIAIDSDIRRVADQADLPTIDDVAPERFKELGSVNA